MLNKKRIILIVLIIFIIFILLFMTRKNRNNNETKNENNINKNYTVKSFYNNETSKYEIIDEKTGEIIMQSEFEEDINSQMDFYKENPDYRANPPISPNAEDIIEY